MPYGSSNTMFLPGGTMIARNPAYRRVPKWEPPQLAPVNLQTAVLALMVDLSMTGLVPLSFPGTAVTLFLGPWAFSPTRRENRLSF